MKLYIDTKSNKFDLWDFLHLNNDIFEINFTDIKIKEEEDKKKDKTIDTIEVSLKPIASSKKHRRITYYAKLFETLKLFLKTHNKDKDDLD